MKAFTEVTQPWQFRVDGMHCIRCVRSVQSLGSEDESVTSLHVDLSRKLVNLQGREAFSPVHFIARLQESGFDAHQVSVDTANKEKKQWFLARMGVAAACAGNIMLFSFADYFGAETSGIEHFLRILNGLLFLPVITFSAWPFYKNAWLSLKHKKISLDGPVSLALLFGGLFSYSNLMKGSAHLYFDSLAMFTFFLLVSRYLIWVLQDHWIQPLSLIDLFPSKDVCTVSNSKDVRVELNEIQPGMILKLSRKDIVPVDSELLMEKSLVDTSVMTGEAEPVEVYRGQKILAGTQLLQEETLVKALSQVKNSRIFEILQMANQGLHRKSRMMTLADRGAWWLTLSIVSAAVLLMLGVGSSHMAEGFNKALALLVVACPCGLAIVIPFAQSFMHRMALKKGVLIKDSQALESLAQVEEVVFDKTGTLTKPLHQHIHWTPEIPKSEDLQLLYSMELKSEHPLARTMTESLARMKPEWLKDKPLALSVTELPGKGIETHYNGSQYSVVKSSSDSKASFLFLKEGAVLAEAHVREILQPEAKELMSALADKQKMVLTGDHEGRAEELRLQLGLGRRQIASNMSPEEKQEYVRSANQNHGVLFVGDGVNDILAMSEASVSVSVHSSTESSFKSSDIHLLKSDLKVLSSLFAWGKSYQRVVRFNLALSFLYNSSFALIAAFGGISPLVAVVIMPLSSLSVLFLTWLQLRRCEL